MNIVFMTTGASAEARVRRSLEDKQRMIAALRSSCNCMCFGCLKSRPEHCGGSRCGQ